MTHSNFSPRRIATSNIDKIRLRKHPFQGFVINQAIVALNLSTFWSYLTSQQTPSN